MFRFVIDIQLDQIDIEFKNIRRDRPLTSSALPTYLAKFVWISSYLTFENNRTEKFIFFRVVEHLIKKSLCGTTRYFVKAHVLLQLSGMIWSVIFSAKRCQFIQRLYNNYNPILHIYRVFRKNCGFFLHGYLKFCDPFPASSVGLQLVILQNGQPIGATVHKGY